MYIYIYIYMYIYIYIYMLLYIYICIERERDTYQTLLHILLMYARRRRVQWPANIKSAAASSNDVVLEEV